MDEWKPAVLGIAVFLAIGAGIVARLVRSQDAPATARPADEQPAEQISPIEDDPRAFARLGPARPGDWRASHPTEGAMSFDDYVASGPVQADDARNTLAFLPVGDFGAPQRAALDAAVEFAGIWFQIPVHVLPQAPLTDDDEQFRVRDDEAGRSERQYRTRWFLNELLPNALPDDAVVLLGVTAADIYPGRDWNFVFGEADLRRRVGVYSLARYFPEFWGGERTPYRDGLALLRTLKVVVHEAGHAFGLEHCVDFACAMNGTNSLTETDRAPLRLCPVCLKKLAWNRGFEIVERYRRLAEFLDAHGLVEEATWYRERLGRSK